MVYYLDCDDRLFVGSWPSFHHENVVSSALSDADALGGAFSAGIRSWRQILVCR